MRAYGINPCKWPLVSGRSWSSASRRPTAIGGSPWSPRTVVHCENLGDDQVRHEVCENQRQYERDYQIIDQRNQSGNLSVIERRQ